MGRAYGRTPAEILGIEDATEAALINVRCYLQGKRADHAALRDMRRDKQIIFPNFAISRGP